MTDTIYLGRHGSHLYTHGAMQLPLPQAEIDIILPIKLGQRNWLDLQPQLEDLTLEVNALAAASPFPDQINQGAVDDFINIVSFKHYGISDGNLR